jgi:hypothetical protein
VEIQVDDEGRACGEGTRDGEDGVPLELEIALGDQVRGVVVLL